MMQRPIIFAWFVLAFAALAQTKPGDVENGKRLYMKNGCYQCHGTVGQGGAAAVGGQAAPRLAQTKLPLIGFIAYVRNPPSGEMPQYRAKVMSDQELADVYAHIKTFPEPPPVKSIPMLNQ
ncbi:MAG: c-type cytochrome [Bryobacteraceae bacterium]|jgi:mono/diheme cytochrome c family protein